MKNISTLIKSFLSLLPLLSIIISKVNVFKIDPSIESQTIKVRQYEKFSIELKGNPTTGYQWILDNNNTLSNSEIIKYSGSDNTGRYVSGKEDGKVGVGGLFLFDFYAYSEGEELIELSYKRVWEKETEPVHIVKIYVYVQNESLYGLGLSSRCDYMSYKLIRLLLFGFIFVLNF